MDANLGTGIATGQGTDTLSGFENLRRLVQRRHLRGDDAANTINGGAGGDDTLDGGLGNDTLDGGAGPDTVEFPNATQSVTVDLGARAPRGPGHATR